MARWRRQGLVGLRARRGDRVGRAGDLFASSKTTKGAQRQGRQREMTGEGEKKKINKAEMKTMQQGDADKVGGCLDSFQLTRFSSRLFLESRTSWF